MTEKDYDFCVENFSDGVYRFLLKHTQDSVLAEDIVQDTFMRLWERKEDVSPLKMKSYIYTTAYHKLVDEMRRNIKVINKEDIILQTKNIYTDIKDVLDKALYQLPEIQKTIILLRDYEGYSYNEIGEILELSEQQVKVYIFRARVALKTYIGKIENII